MTPARAWRAFAGLAAVAYALIVLGALVRAHGAGLACPDWPLCFGVLVPAFDTRVALEWGHRALAGTLSLGLVAAAFLVWRPRELRARVSRSLALAFGLLALQVVLGGLTVLLGLAPWTVTAHLLVGNLFCATLLWIALDLRGGRVRAAGPSGLASGVALVASLLALQVALGGLVSSHYAGLSCTAFPSCDGSSWAPSFSGPMGLHVLHRFTAYALTAAAVALAWRARSGVLGRRPLALVGLIGVQLVLGVANVLLALPVEVTALHSATAAAIVLVTASLVRSVVRERSGSTAPSRSAGRAALEAA